MKRRSKKHLFLWLRNRTTENRKGKKAQNIKGKWQSKNFSTVSRLHVVLHSSQRDNIYNPKRLIALQKSMLHPRISVLGCFLTLITLTLHLHPILKWRNKKLLFKCITKVACTFKSAFICNLIYWFVSI